MVYQSRHLPNLLLFILSSTLALGILETGLRQFTAFPIHGLEANLIPDEKLVYRLRPSVPGIDANGFRNSQTQKQVGLVAIGDSHTYGSNVRTEDSWPYQLADLTGMTVYNFGIGGYGILQYHHLMDEAIKLKPQVIVIGLYLANDIINPCQLIITMDYWQNWADRKGFNTQSCSDADYLSPFAQRQNDRLRRGGGGSDAVEYVSQRSAIASLTRHLAGQVKNIISPPDPITTLVISEPKNQTVISHHVVPIFKYHMDLQEIEINLGFEITKAVLKEAKQKSDLNGIDLYIAFIPSKVRVFYDYLVDRNYKLPDDYHRLVEHEYNLIKEFSAFFNEIDLGFVDVQPQVVQALQNTGSVYSINHETHPLEVGYRAYAQGIHEHFFARDAINQIR